MTPVTALSHGPELFVYTFESVAALVASAAILWPITYTGDRMTETPEFSGCPELYIRRGFKSFMKLAEAEVANELMWVVSGLADRINA